MEFASIDYMNRECDECYIDDNKVKETPSIMSNLPNHLIIDIIKIALDAKRVEVDKETHRNKLIDCLITRPTDNFACNFYESHMGYDYWLYTQLDEDEEFMIDESWEDIQKYR